MFEAVFIHNLTLTLFLKGGGGIYDFGLILSFFILFKKMMEEIKCVFYKKLTQNCHFV